ncbi:HD-GYP domain-containing protein [Ornithinicoccus halotolerans]|uniref:HD-GYP domain-containing protein n=1 Tax=Ornithinicoccus halotolerans TaxID=1748220 RepID=UPI00129533EF|nr:HD domain-containing phosphohydrolase [Ornithinicoccus halotolerans]
MNRLTLDRAVSLLAGLIVLAGLVLAAPVFLELPGETRVGHAAFMLTIAAGETWRTSVVGARRFAPVALAASLAWAMTPHLPGPWLADHRGGFVVVGTLVATVLGMWVHQRRTGAPIVAREVALRVIVVGVAVLVYRVLPVGGSTVCMLVEGWSEQRWAAALVMVGTAVAAMTAYLTLGVMLRAADHHARLGHTLTDEVSAVGPLAVATTLTAAVIAIAYEGVGPVGVPLFLVPLLLLQLAVARQSAIRQARQQTLQALSRLTEQGGFTPPGHSARVARLSVLVGRRLGMHERELADLEAAALLHDLGQVSLRRPIPGGATLEVSPLDQRRIAQAGAAILARTTELARLAPVVADQATPARRSDELTATPLGARIIKVVNSYDDLIGGHPDHDAVAAALARMRLSVGDEYDPQVFRALCAVLHRDKQMSSHAYARLDI